MQTPAKNCRCSPEIWIEPDGGPVDQEKFINQFFLGKKNETKLAAAPDSRLPAESGLMPSNVG
jgi:hypothetical protein